MLYIPFSTIRCELGEGVLWDGITQRLFWVDISKGKVYEADANGQVLCTYLTGEISSTVALTKCGDVLVTGQSKIYHFLRGEHKSHACLTNLPIPNSQRLNDGKCDPTGAFIVGAMTLNGTHDAKLFRVVNGRYYVLADGIGCSNGLGFSPNKRFMYYIDTPLKAVWRFSFGENGKLSQRTALVDTSVYPGVPDGMTVDREGNLWVAMWGDSSVCCFSWQDGTLLARISLPAKYITSCTFGGKGLDTLFISTAAFDDEKDKVSAGLVYKVLIGNLGMPTFRYLY